MPEGEKYFSGSNRVNNLPQALLLAGVFVIGLYLAFFTGFLGIIAYFLLWIASYPVIYAGTCRYCAYYGNKCPVPLEGACVHHFFSRSHKTFGYMQLFWALVAYALRISVPVIAVFLHAAYLPGLAFALVLAAFWIVHLRVTGCPNCVNTSCPLNGRS